MSRIIKFTLLSTLILFFSPATWPRTFYTNQLQTFGWTLQVDSPMHVIADKSDGLLFVSILDASPGTTVLLGWNKK
jgi:hypothetical protein